MSRRELGSHFHEDLARTRIAPEVPDKHTSGLHFTGFTRAHGRLLEDAVGHDEGKVAVFRDAARGRMGAQRFEVPFRNRPGIGRLAGDEAVRSAYVPGVLALMARILTFPTITVAAINGHSFGAGAQLTLAHDYRVMRSERGYWCMPEIDIKVPLHPGMTAIIQARLSHATAHELIVTGTRYNAEAALEKGIVDHRVPQEEVLSKSVEIAAALAAKADPTMQALKVGMYSRVLEAMRGEN